MTLRVRRLRRTALFAGTLATLTVVGTLTAVPAAAAPIGEPLINMNGSDPHAWNCYDAATQRSGICLTASQDMGNSAYPGNDYPMQNTNMWFLPATSDPSIPSNWLPRGNPTGSPKIFDESQWVGEAPNAYHLWAPATTVYQNKHWLFVPDVLSKDNVRPPAWGIQTSSRIGVAQSNGPFGPYTWRRILDLGDRYASDPAPYQELSQLWLAYADGDWGTGTDYPCGGIAITELAYSPTQGITGSVNPSGNHRVTFTFPGGQQPSWWNGCANNTKPYFEGPELYSFPNADGTRGYDYVLLFAMKPSTTPPECATSRGQPGTANSVIAYATATTLSSRTFQYRGIIVCGSRDSWTNQASMARFANGRYVLFYHDAGPANPSGNPPSYWNRTIRAQCVDYNPNTGTFSNIPIVRAPNKSSLRSCWAS